MNVFWAPITKIHRLWGMWMVVWGSPFGASYLCETCIVSEKTQDAVNSLVMVNRYAREAELLFLILLRTLRIS